MNEKKHIAERYYIGTEIKTVIYIGTDRIISNSRHPRTILYKSAMERLTESVRRYGIIYPVIVTRNYSGHYILVSGERRLQAAKAAGLSKLPAVVISADEKQAEFIMLAENIHRENLCYLDEADTYRRLIFEFGSDIDELSELSGRSRESITELLETERLDDNTRDILLKSKLGEQYALLLLRIPDTEPRVRMAETFVRLKLNIWQAEAAVNSLLQEPRSYVRRQRTENTAVAKLPEKQKEVHIIWGDYRIIDNTIKKAVELIKGQKLTAMFQKKDHGGCIEYIIRVEKTADGHK